MRAPWGLLPLLAITFAVGCDGAPPTGSHEAAQVQAVTVDALTGTVGSTLPTALAVRVLDDRGRAMGGVTVAWSVTAGGGAVDPATSVTDMEGVARASWTLGPSAGTQGAKAAVGEIAPVLFTATARPEAVALAAPTSGNGQSGEVAGVLSDSLVVRVADRYGNPVPNVAVAWLVSAGGGAVSPAATATNDSGLVKARWALGPAVGAQAVGARAAGVAEAHAQFRAAAEARPGSIVLSPWSGDAQTGTVGRTLSGPLGVRAVDRLGRAVSGLSVAWEATEGAG
ncbi:MAG TPA: Ig-like domain-containing protein, partial [Longimicrobiaceae bacterium]|nr:Ig-like domain-containing protein [Longimicrobiaceae bacterium]